MIDSDEKSNATEDAMKNAIKNAIKNATKNASYGGQRRTQAVGDSEGTEPNICPIVTFQERSEKSSLYRTGTQGASTQQMCKNSKLRGAA